MDAAAESITLNDGRLIVYGPIHYMNAEELLLPAVSTRATF